MNIMVYPELEFFKARLNEREKGSDIIKMDCRIQFSEGRK